MRKPIIVSNGIHGAGKTTISKSLADRHQILDFQYEIGGHLRQQVTFNALSPVQSFDEQVMRAELARDKGLLHSGKIPIVETWHVGNIAYAQKRSPEVAGLYRIAFERQMQHFMPYGLFFDIDDSTFFERMTERVSQGEHSQLLDFYRGIQSAILNLYQEYAIPYQRIVNTNTIEQALREAEGFLSIQHGLIETAGDRELRLLHNRRGKEF